MSAEEKINLTKKVHWPVTLALATITWLVVFILAMVYMWILGVNPQNPGEEWNMNHPQYWPFEALITPTLVLIVIVLFSYYHLKISMDADLWFKESLAIGLIVMFIQFLLDFIVIVLLFGNSDHFVGFVTISYLLIPIWSVLAGWFWKGR